MGCDKFHTLKVYEFDIICSCVKMDELTQDAEEEKEWWSRTWKQPLNMNN